MVNIARNCVVCSRITSDFSYGVDCCNACKMFFRRRILKGGPTKICLSGNQSCSDENLISCQFCRFHKCLQVGMTFLPLLQKESLNVLIDNIFQLDSYRKRLLQNFYPIDPSLSVSTVFLMRKIVYIEGGGPRDFAKWTYITSVSTIEFLKKLAFVYLAKYDDQIIIAKSSFINVASFCAAFRAVSTKQVSLTFPDGTDILPNFYKYLMCNLKELEGRIKSRLVGKLYDLKISYEEYLLVLVIIICNPALPNLSETGRILLSSYQNFYSSSLLQYCMLTYQRYGPTRFTELLSITSVISKHFEDVNNYFVVLQLNSVNCQMHDIVKEGLNLL